MPLNGNHLCTPDPDATSILPIDDDDWDRGVRLSLLQDDVELEYELRFFLGTLNRYISNPVFSTNFKNRSICTPCRDYQSSKPSAAPNHKQEQNTA